VTESDSIGVSPKRVVSLAPRRENDFELCRAGLAITRAIMDAHGGEIAFAFEAGLTCFTLRFPNDSFLASDANAHSVQI
jgi:hypothetical protein